jgi:hypothetical protein
MRHFELTGIALLLLASCANLQGGSGDCLLRIHGIEEQGHLVLDGIDHGPIRADHIFSEMSPGTHVIELRRDTIVASRTALEIPPGSRADIHIDVPLPVVPIVRALPNSKPAPSNTEPTPEIEPILPESQEVVLEAREEESTSEPAHRRPITPRHSESSRQPREAPPPEAQPSSPEPLEDSRTWARRVLDIPSATPPMERPSEPRLPTQPPRDETQRAMALIHAPILACANGQHGIATVRLRVIGATGHVSEVQVTGYFAGTPVAACIERAARTASFSPFGRNWIDINYPFRL